MQGRNEIIISDDDFIERFELNIEEIVEAKMKAKSEGDDAAK